LAYGYGYIVPEGYEELFSEVFTSKLLREQLSYFEDIDCIEQVIFSGKLIDKEEIKKYFINTATFLTPLLNLLRLNWVLTSNFKQRN